MVGIFPRITMASFGQVRTHLVQLIQPFLQASITNFPFCEEVQEMCAIALYGTSVIKFFGQTLRHFPQALHFSLSTTAIPLTMLIAS